MFRPDYVLRSVTDTPLDQLWCQGIRCILIDVDNTLALWNDGSLSDPVKDWVQKAKEKGFVLILLTNNSIERVRPVMRQLQVQAFSRVGKPSRRAFLRAAMWADVPACRCAMVGDQLITDMLGARRVHMVTLLVNPLDLSREFWGTRINRCLEFLWLRLIGVRRPR